MSDKSVKLETYSQTMAKHKPDKQLIKTNNLTNEQKSSQQEVNNTLKTNNNNNKTETDLKLRDRQTAMAKKDDDKKGMESDDQKTRKMFKKQQKHKLMKKYLKMLENEAKRLTQIIIPISLCMFLVILSLHFFPVFSQSIWSNSALAQNLPGFQESPDTPADKRFYQALAIAVIFVILMACVTFVMAVIIIYEFMSCIQIFFIFAFVIYFGLFGTGYLFIATREYNIAIDWFTVALLMWNYTGVGLVIFFIAGPKLLQQTYLILLSSNVALILLMVIPDWTLWLLLCLMSIWDLYAVLHKTGPLNQMLNSMEKNEKKMPPLLYSTAIWLEVKRKSSETMASIKPNDSQENYNNNDNDNEDDVDSAVQLGLGDFVFYSVLVGKSFASGDLLTAIMCYISITVGLAITLFILLLKNMPLPALPISITLGVIMNFSSKYFIIPFNDSLTDKLIFI